MEKRQPPEFLAGNGHRFIQFHQLGVWLVRQIAVDANHHMNHRFYRYPGIVHFPDPVVHIFSLQFIKNKRVAVASPNHIIRPVFLPVFQPHSHHLFVFDNQLLHFSLVLNITSQFFIQFFEMEHHFHRTAQRHPSLSNTAFYKSGQRNHRKTEHGPSRRVDYKANGFTQERIFEPRRKLLDSHFSILHKSAH